jgi:hypothetical protein
MRASKTINPISSALKRLVLAGALLLGSASARASTASVSGPWNDTVTWGGSAVPTSSDPVIINSGITVNVPAGIAAECSDLTVSGAATSMILDDATSSLTVSGNVLVDRPNVTGNINQLNVGAGTFSAGSLVLGSGSSTTGSTRKTDLLIATGTATITGGITTFADAARITFSGAGTLNAGGSFTWATSAPTFTPATGTVNYHGTGSQTVLALAYHNLTLSGSGAKTMGTGISVTGKLTIAPTGSAFASVANGANLLVSELTLGAANQVNGTWGSTGSTATHQDDTYFDVSTSGILTVGPGIVLITPVAATAQSWFSPDDRAPGHAIDGSGMTPNSPVTTGSTCGTGPGGNMWLSDGNQDTWITFDLGSVQTITGFHLWNYNEYADGLGSLGGRGVQTAGIYAGTSLPADGTGYASAGPAWGTLVENMTFTPAPETAGYTGEDYYFATPVTTRHIQIYVTSNFGTSDAYTGISEIRFIPPGAAQILSFGTNVAGSSAVVSPVVGGTATIAWTLPYDPYGKPGGAALIAALTPAYTLSSGTCDKDNGGPTTYDFSSPVVYTVTDTSTEPDTINTYTVTATVAPVSTACDMTVFNAGLAGSTATITTTSPASGTVVVHVPYGTTEGDVNLLAPTYTLSSAFATCNQTNNAVPSPALSLTTPVHYIVTAQDGTTKDYTVTVVVNPEPPAGVTGLALWLDAAQITGLANGATVDTWADMSGQENHALRASGAPTYQASVINGQPVVRFYSDAAVGDYFGFPRINTIRTVFWVLKEDEVHTTERSLFLLGDSDSYEFHRGGDALWAGGAASGYITGGTTRLMGTVVDGTTTALPRNSFQLVSLVTTGNVQANQITQDRIFHGSWKGDIAEVLIYSRALTPEEEAAVGKYLATKYGLVSSYTAATIVSFGANVAGSSAVINPVVGGAATIAWTVPYGTAVTNLMPSYTLSSGTCDKDNGGPAGYDFSGTVVYTVTDASTDPDTINAYTVTATIAPPSTACDMLAFDANLAGSSAIVTTNATTGTVAVNVPFGTTEAQMAALKPSYTLSSYATCDQPNGNIPTPALSLTAPVHYLVTAQSGATKDYTVTVVVYPWARYAWTGDADSGITSASPYTVAVNCNGDAVSVNGVAFESQALSGANFSIGGDVVGWGPDGAPNVTGNSATLANTFIYGGNPRTLTLTNLTPGKIYETSLFAFGFDAAGNARSQTFASGMDSLVVDQNLYGQNNGIRIAYTFVADSSGSKVLTITPVDAGYTFHLSALANRLVAAPVVGYDAWAAANGATGQTPADDHDHDGVPNGIEWFLTGSNNSTGFTALPGVVKDPGTGVLSVTWTKDAGYTGAYGTGFWVETSGTLTGTWTRETIDVNVTITGDEVKYTFPPAPGSRMFARLVVTQTP